MPGEIGGGKKECPVEGHDEGPGELLPTMREQNFRGLWCYLPRSAGHFRRELSGRWLSYAGRQALLLRLRAFHATHAAELRGGRFRMALTYSFRFLDDDLNRRLIALLKRSGVRHVVGT